jgi:tyrosyl-tRNA synthetase
MYGKLMSISDDLMMRYYELLTVTNLKDVKQQHPMEAKMALAEQLVRQYHGENGAGEAKADFQQRFQKRDFPDEPDLSMVLKPTSFSIAQNPSMSMVDVLLWTGKVLSKGEARRLISQHAIKVDGEKMSDINAVIDFEPGRQFSLKIGKRIFVLVDMVDE